MNVYGKIITGLAFIWIIIYKKLQTSWMQFLIQLIKMAYFIQEALQDYLKENILCFYQLLFLKLHVLINKKVKLEFNFQKYRVKFGEVVLLIKKLLLI